MRKDAELVIGLLPKLDARERAQVRTLLGVLESDQDEEKDSDAELLWNGIVRVGADRRVSLPPFARIRSFSAFARFQEDARQSLAWLREGLALESKTELIQAIHLGARALLARLARLRDNVGLELTPLVVMRQSGNLPAAVESQWPGGLAELRFLLRRGH